MPEAKSALVLRERRDGTVSIVGDAPDQHVFPGRWIDRKLGKAVRVWVTLTTDEGDVEYELTGFERRGDGEPNLSGWICERVTSDA